jgi:hypothetical protein
MTNMLGVRGGWLAPIAIVFLLAGCVQPAQFDTSASKAAAQMRDDTLALIDKSGDKYATRKPEVDTLMARYQAAQESAAKNEANKAVAEAWQIIIGPKSGSAGEYFDMWRRSGTMSPGIRKLKKPQIARQFGLIVCMEDSKPGGPGCSTPPPVTPAADAGDKQ